ncbi:MAG: primosomal protein N' [Opitutales bacterium]|nr:primosomal protein N' [Opitutales bacterium]
MDWFPETVSSAPEGANDGSAEFVGVMPFDGGGRAYTYRVPARFSGKTALGSLVKIPLGARVNFGVVWKTGVVPAAAWAKKVRDIAELCCDVPVLTPDALKLCEWLAAYYAAPLNSVLLTILPSTVRRGVRPVTEKYISLARELSPDELEKLRRRAKKQAALYELLLSSKHQASGIRQTSRTEKSPEIRNSEFDIAQAASPVLRNALPFSAAVIDALIFAGVAKEEIAVKSRLAYNDDFEGGARGNAVAALPPVLNAEQRAALDSISQSLSEKKFRTHLLHGVTGSGKTEVYIGAVRSVLESGGSAIFLVPEVALTPQTVGRLRSRLSDCATQIVVWHSNLSAGERYDAWMAMARGEARLLVGARSAIFAPLKNLRLIVVDEEHEPSFKQGETPFYHGRDVAVFRAHLCGAVCVLGSATPSLESFFNARNGKYLLNRITKRVDDRAFPPMKIIDMRREILHASGQTTFSRTLINALRERLERREQSILFLNRRGYSRALICPDCGHVLTCPHCSSALTYHRTEELMRCHLCDHVEPAASRCPACGSPKIRWRGFGTQRAEEILKNIFPDAVAVRLDADTMSKKNEFRKILGDFRAGKIDILLGTQMIAKGLDFPRVTLVGILDADLSLHVPDFRASERTFQLLVQVAGRAGRGDLEGEVLVQTFTPHAAPIQFAKRADFDEFLEDELERRKEFGYPPLRHVIRHLFRGQNAELVEETADRWAEFLEQNAPDLCEIRGPAPCPTEKIQDNYRFHIWYFCDNVVRASSRLVQLRDAFPWPQDVIDLLDVDPADVN